VSLSFRLFAPLCHWRSCSKETSDLAKGTIFRQTLFVCLCISNGKELLCEKVVGEGLTHRCIFNRRWWVLEISRLSGLLSPFPSVHIGWSLLRKTLPRKTVRVTSPAHFPRKRTVQKNSFFACFVGCIRLCGSLSDWTTGQKASSRHGARDYFSLHIARRCVVCVAWSTIVPANSAPTHLPPSPPICCRNFTLCY